jgi:O-antigen/teichoic acid export membrane protein
MNNIIEEETKDLKNIFQRFKTKNFSGTTGEVIKNSTYNLGTTLAAKFGSLFFTIAIARIMGVELFGLYTLAISTILLFSITSDLGISTAMLTFSSKSLGENKLGKAKTYFKGLLRYKFYLITFSSLTLIIFGYFLATYYYVGKPIYYALLAGAIYIPMSGLLDYINASFQAGNNFRAGMIKEIIFQLSRLTLVPLSIFYLLKTSLKISLIVAMIVLVLSFCYFVGLLYLRLIAKKQIPFLREKATKLTDKEKKELKKFILPLTFMALSGTFFGFIDMLMLGHYVDTIYIGYYGAGFALIGSATALIGFVAGVMLPTFSRLKGKPLEKFFKKAIGFTLFVGLFSAMFTLLLAKYILLIYGKQFIPGTILLQILSIMLIITPISGIYGAYFISMKKTLIVAKLLILSTLVNIILNIWFITYGLQFGMIEAAVGACVATIFSRVFYLAGLIIYKNSSKIKIPPKLNPKK